MTNSAERHSAPPYTADSVAPPFEQEVSPETKAKVESIKDILREKLREIDSPEKARQVVEALMAQADHTPQIKIRNQQEETGEEEPEKAVEEAAQRSSGVDQTAATILEAARQVAGSEGEIREALEQVVQEATNPQHQDTEDETLQKPMEMLREEMLQHMQPLQSIDARIFLAINHLPHTKASNTFMSTVTNVMNGGFGWVAGLLVAAMLDKSRGLQAFHKVVPPLWFATMAIEFPVKRFFKRQRPFVDVVQAVSVGKKPGNYSFPSGHSAAAFAGAWLIRKHYPELTPFLYGLASLVGFTRIYLGAHYPGDVVSGAVAGTVLAEATRWFIDQADETTQTHPVVQALRDRVNEINPPPKSEQAIAALGTTAVVHPVVQAIRDMLDDIKPSPPTKREKLRAALKTYEASHIHPVVQAIRDMVDDIKPSPPSKREQLLAALGISKSAPANPLVQAMRGIVDEVKPSPPTKREKLRAALGFGRK